MQFQATIEQVKQMAANAINASVPMGMGYMHYIPKAYTAADVNIPHPDRGLSVDYFEGRMVKLYVGAVSDGVWEISNTAQSDYQSWASTYTPQSLVESVGAVILSQSA